MVILRSLVTDPSTVLRQIEILTAEERRRLVKDFNDNAQSFTSERLLHQLFEDHVRVAPEQTAVVYEDQRWTYDMLNRRANQLARHLHQVGVTPSSLVAISLNRSIESIMCLLAILKAGCAYVPIDPAQPRSRIAQMLDQLGPCLIVTQQRLVPRLEGDKRRFVCLDVDAEQIAQQSGYDLPNKAAPEDHCRMIEANYQSLTGISQAYLSEQRGKLDNILDGCLHRMLALQRYEKMPLSRDPDDLKEEIVNLERELKDDALNDRARAALQKNLELKRRLLGSYREVGGTMKALETELDSMASLLEVLHQNSIALRDPQAISEELDTIVRQSEDSERVVREMEALLRSDSWSADLAAMPAAERPKVPPIPAPPRQKVKGR